MDTGEKSVPDPCVGKKVWEDSGVGLRHVNSRASKETSVTGAEERRRNLKRWPKATFLKFRGPG